MLPSKGENLSRCSTKIIHFCKNLSLALERRQRKNFFQIYELHIFSIVGVAFAVLLLRRFPKRQLLVVKKS